jgi:predicted dehydrogenase
MKFLQVGLGSMGKRRIRCLKTLGFHDILAFDPREDRQKEAVERYGVRVVPTFEEGLRAAPTAVLVSTPPDLHYAFVRDALRAGCHTFCEVNIVTEGAEELAVLARERGKVVAPSATMCFHPLYQHLRRLVVEEKVVGRPLVLNFHMGNYILDWHPWEGLDFYAGRKATGACREMVPYEFCWMEWIFGPVESVQCTYGRHLDLPTEMDDAYAIVARFASGLLATVLVDVIARYPVRIGRLLSQSGSIDWDFDTNRLRHFDGESRTWRDHKAAARGFNIEEMYVAETEAFVRATRGEGAWLHGYEADERLGRILLACERSGKTGALVRVDEVSR